MYLCREYYFYLFLRFFYSISEMFQHWYFFFHYIYRINMNKVQLMSNYVSILQRKFVKIDCKTCIFLLIIDIYVIPRNIIVCYNCISNIYTTIFRVKREVWDCLTRKTWYKWFVTWSHAISHLGRWLLHCSSGWVWEPLRLTTHKWIWRTVY